MEGEFLDLESGLKTLWASEANIATRDTPSIRAFFSFLRWLAIIDVNRFPRREASDFTRITYPRSTRSLHKIWCVQYNSLGFGRSLPCETPNP